MSRVRPYATFLPTTLNPTTSLVMTPPAVEIGDCVVIAITSRGHTAATADVTVTDNSGDGVSWTMEFTNPSDHITWLFRKIVTTSAGLGSTITVAGGVNSLTAVGINFKGAHQTSPIANTATESNAAGDETHAAFTPAYGNCAVGMAVHNTLDDLAVTSAQYASLGTGAGVHYLSAENRSTGGLDCGTLLCAAVMIGGPATTGTFSWAQTNGTVRTNQFIVRSADDDVQYVGGGYY